MSAHRVMKDLFKAFTPDVGPAILKDPGSGGTIKPTMYGQICPVVTAGAEARTLAQPDRPGLLFSVVLDTDGGDLTLTVTGGYNQDDDTTIVFDDAGDIVVFISNQEGSNYYWRAVGQDGTTAATEVGAFDSISIGGTAITATATEINNVADASARVQSLTGAAAVTVDGSIGVASIDSGGAYAITLAAPSAAMRGRILVIEYGQGATDAVTLALTNVQGGSAATTATFNADNETLILVGGESKWNVLAEIGVTLA